MFLVSPVFPYEPRICHTFLFTEAASHIDWHLVMGVSGPAKTPPKSVEAFPV